MQAQQVAPAERAPAGSTTDNQRAPAGSGGEEVAGRAAPKRGIATMSPKRLGRRLFLAFAGNIGAHIASIVTLWATLAAAGCPEALFLEITATTLLLRLMSCIEPHTRPVLEICPVRKYFRNVAYPELRYSVALPAAAYLLGWPLVKTVIPAAIILNALAQLGHFALARKILTHLRSLPRLGIRRDARNRVLIVGTGAQAQSTVDMILSSPELDAAIDGFLDYHRRDLWRYRDIPLIGHPDALREIASHAQIDSVVLAVEPDDMPMTASLLATAESMGVPVCLLPGLYRTAIARPVHANLNGTPTVAYRRVPEEPVAVALKNIIDRIGAVVGLVLALPIMIAAAVAIKFESPGPVFFRQIRSGANGRLFPLLKFRTMTADADRHKDSLKDLNEMSGPVFKIRNDPRVTRTGRFLRKYSIDEIPQFINVLRGEMSLVGPRPPLPSEVANYEPWQRRKLSVKPGLTCIWQVSGRNQIDFEDWMKLDLEYIDNWSLWLDARIIARTIPTVIRANGAS